MIKASFHDAGHILGSAGIFIDTGNEKLFYTEDVNLSHQSLIDKAKLPKTNVDILILETTYGSTDTGTLLAWNTEAKRFASEAKL
jgi:Cft2 family RNA processing exonuclease